MKLYVTYTKDSFTNRQLEELSKVGEVIFLENTFNLDEAPYLNDDNEKILVVDPDWYNWDINADHLSKIKNLKGVCLSTTAFDWIDLNYSKLLSYKAITPNPFFYYQLYYYLFFYIPS